MLSYTNPSETLSGILVLIAFCGMIGILLYSIARKQTALRITVLRTLKEEGPLSTKFLEEIKKRKPDVLISFLFAETESMVKAGYIELKHTTSNEVEYRITSIGREHLRELELIE